MLRNASVAAGTAAAIAAAMPAMALAENAGGITAILPDLNEFIPMVVAFLIVAVVLGKFGWPVLENIIEKRESSIKEALEKSEEARIESERVLEEYREQLAQARQESIAILAEAKQSGEAVRADIVAKARQSIESEKNAAVAELQSSVADLTVAVVAKVIGEDFSDAEHRKLIESSIAKAGKLDA